MPLLIEAINIFEPISGFKYRSFHYSLQKFCLSVSLIRTAVLLILLSFSRQAPRYPVSDQSESFFFSFPWSWRLCSLQEMKFIWQIVKLSYDSLLSLVLVLLRTTPLCAHTVKMELMQKYFGDRLPTSPAPRKPDEILSPRNGRTPSG